MNLTLTRFGYLTSCTLGTLFADACTKLCFPLAMIEPPWIPDKDGPGGAPFRSCVPDGVYILRPRHSMNHDLHYVLVNEALGVYASAADIPKGQSFGRFECLIHIANYARELSGCLAPGLHHANDELRVIESGKAMDRLRDVLGDRGNHQLTIRPHGGTQEKAA